jgi:hypothetical protein
MTLTRVAHTQHHSSFRIIWFCDSATSSSFFIISSNSSHSLRIQEGRQSRGDRFCRSVGAMYRYGFQHCLWRPDVRCLSDEADIRMVVFVSQFDRRAKRDGVGKKEALEISAKAD